MWFKQVQLFQLDSPIDYSPEKIQSQLAPFSFTPCLPSLPSSTGWVSPFADNDMAPIIHAANGYIMLCLQSEEKILPASVVRQALDEKIKQVQKRDDRKIRSKEKLALKDEVIMTLLPRAFTKLNRVYAYIDIKNNLLVIGASQAARVEQFVNFFKRAISENVRAFDIKKVAPIMTEWLKSQKYPKEFAVEKSCMLQDSQQQARIIRCQHQDLFAQSIQNFLKEGCEVKQLAITWHDRVKFLLCEDFSLRNIQFQEEILTAAQDIDSETREQQFDADFYIMTNTFSGMFEDLLSIFVQLKNKAVAKEADLMLP
jgi:recombination associated protein RdgC